MVEVVIMVEEVVVVQVVEVVVVVEKQLRDVNGEFVCGHQGCTWLSLTGSGPWSPRVGRFPNHS